MSENQTGWTDPGHVEKFRLKIVEYWNEEGRKNLPWRLTDDPWKILIAEMLLRKTTARQAMVIYDKISCLSPRELSRMNTRRLSRLLRPLGMHRVRANQLRGAAEAVAIAGRDGLRDEAFVRGLIGVGMYISNCVQCFAYDVAKPAFDTNMIRVLSRVFDYKSKRSRPRDDTEFWIFAESLVPEEDCKEYNWGIIDLAAAICKPRVPICDKCPVCSICIYGMSSSGN